MRLLSLCYWGFYVLLLKPCAPDPGGRQGGDCVVAGCTGGCRYDSLLCDRWGIVDLFEPANTALLWSLFFKTSYPVSCMYVRDFIVILLNTCYYICIYVSWRFLTKFYDMCNPEILCNCLFYLLFTCTLSEMMNKRCPINQSIKQRNHTKVYNSTNVSLGTIQCHKTVSKSCLQKETCLSARFRHPG